MTFTVATRTNRQSTTFNIVSIVLSIRTAWTTLPTTISKAMDV